MSLDEYRSSIARRELSKGISNLDGSSHITGTEGSRTAKRSVAETELQARWNLAFGKITREEFDERKESGEFDDE